HTPAQPPSHHSLALHDALPIFSGQKERLPAKIVATDQTRMLTLLKVEAKGLPVPVPAPKKDLKVGHWGIAVGRTLDPQNLDRALDRKSTRLNSSHQIISYAVFC